MIVITIHILIFLYILIIFSVLIIEHKQAKLNQQYEKYCKETGQPIDDRLEINEMMGDEDADTRSL